MITIEKTPALIAFSGNPMRFHVLTNSQFSISGNVASLQLQFTNIDTTPGHYFSFGMMSMILTFTTATTPDESGQQIPVAITGDTPSSWCAKVGVAMMENYYLHTFYNITISGTSLLFTAKTKGILYTIIFININVNGISQSVNTGGVDPLSYTGFGILAQVFDVNNNLVGEDFRPVALDGRTMFDISEFLDSILQGFTPPHFNIIPTTGNMHCFTDGILIYQVAFCEKYEGTTKRLYTDNQRSAVLGGLSREALVYWNEENPWWEDPDNLMKFLTWCQSGKLTSMVQMERLYFFNPSYSSLTLNIKVTFSVGSVVLITGSPITVTPNSIVELQVGYEDLLLGSIDPSRDVISYQIWLTNNSTTISEVYEFDLDPRIRENDRQFLFRNSFGWYDAALFTGKIESDLEYDRIDGYTVIEEEETVYNAPDRAFSNPEQQTFNGSSGWICSSTLEWLRDMFLSREIYEIIDGKCYPIVITIKKVVKCKDMDMGFQLNIEYKRAYQDIYFSILEIPEGINPGGDPGSGTKFLTWDNTHVTFDEDDITFDQTLI
jgi:hypothetical protein